jgi:hypothetical protein
MLRLTLTKTLASTVFVSTIVCMTNAIQVIQHNLARTELIDKGDRWVSRFKIIDRNFHEIDHIDQQTFFTKWIDYHVCHELRMFLESSLSKYPSWQPSSDQ